MGRPEWSSTLSSRQYEAISEMVFNLRREGFGWRECARLITSRFPTVSVSKDTLAVSFWWLDPQKEMSASRIAKLQNDRRAQASSRAWWRRRRAYVYAKYKEAAGK